MFHAFDSASSSKHVRRPCGIRRKFPACLQYADLLAERVIAAKPQQQLSNGLVTSLRALRVGPCLGA